MSSELSRQFRGPLPASVEALPADAAADLATALRDARRKQSGELKAATEESLRQVPRLLRPVVRKVIGL